MYYCYVLKSIKTGGIYIGHTDNLKAEILRHNNGEIPKTERKRLWRIQWYSAFINEDDTKKFEDFLHTEIGLKFISKWLVTHEAEKPMRLKRPIDSIACPICGGKGEAPNEMFFKYGKRYSGHKVICSNCMGNGWIDPSKKPHLNDII